MNILTITALPAGGATYAAQRLHSALVEYGHACTFACCDPVQPGHVALNYQRPDATPFMSPLFRYWSTLSTPETREQGACELFSDTSTLLASPALPDHIVEAADVVHLHWASGILYSPALFRLLRNKKLVWTLHDMNPFTGGCHYHVSCERYEHECGNCPLLAHPAPNDVSLQAHRFKRLLYRELDITMVSPSAWLSDKARRSPLFTGKKVAVIPNTHDTTLFAPRDRASLRSQYGVEKDTFIVLTGVEYLGNPRKNIGCMVEAMELFAQRRPHISFELVLFGAGGADLLASFPTRHVGIVDTESLVDWYNIADVFVHPSRLDNLSNTLCEAQCCGTPVISFDAGGSTEAFQDGETGFISGNQPQHLAEALDRLLSSDMESLRQKARMFAMNRFNGKNIAQRYTDIYEDDIINQEHHGMHVPADERLASNAMDGFLKVAPFDKPAP